MSSIPRDALNTRASKPGVIVVPGSTLSAAARAISFLRIGDVGWRELVHHFGRRVAEHPLGADVEDLDDALRVGGDAGEVGAVEDRALQGPRLEHGLLRLLARRVVGSDEQIANNGVLCVAQRCHRHNCRQAALVLADVSQLVDVFDSASGLEHQGLEARRNRWFRVSSTLSALARAITSSGSEMSAGVILLTTSTAE